MPPFTSSHLYGELQNFCTNSPKVVRLYGNGSISLCLFEKNCQHHFKFDTASSQVDKHSN